MTVFKWRSGSVVVLAYCLFSCSSTLGMDRQAWQLRGFGTIGGAYSSQREADYIGAPIQRRGAGNTSPWSMEVDSMLGVQFDYAFSDQIDGVIQVVSRQYADSGYQPRLEWANIRYRHNDFLSLRAGRVILPAFMVSEFRLVGYAYPWARPPIESYNLMPFTNSDGVDLTFRQHAWGGINSFQALYGNFDAKVVDVTSRGTEVRSARFRSIFAIANTYEVGNWTIRAALITGRAKGEGVDERLRFINAGVAYDAGQWFAQAEWSRLLFPQAALASNASYLTVGLRMGKFTPYATYSQLVSTQTPGPVLANDQRSVSVGGRWDFSERISLKVQLDKVKVDVGTGGVGFFINAMPTFSADGHANVASVVLNFVF